MCWPVETADQIYIIIIIIICIILFWILDKIQDTDERETRNPGK